MTTGKFRAVVDHDPVPAHQIDHRRSRFDRVSESAAGFVSRSGFFVLCVTLLVFWLVAGVLASGFGSMWLEAGAAGMAAVTFILVALLENEQRRNNQALQRKLNAIAHGLLAESSSKAVRAELSAAIGVERFESTD